MTIIVLSIMLVLILIAKYTVSDRLSKIMINLYLLWWMAWLAISTLNVYDLYTVSFVTYLLIFLSLFMFLCGYLISNTKDRKNKDQEDVLGDIHITSNKLFHVLLIINIIILGYYFSKYIYLTTILPTEQIRLLRYTVGGLFSTTEQLLLFNYFVEAFIFFLYAVVAYLIMTKKYLTITFALSIAAILLYAGIGSGRLPIIFLMFSMGLVFLMSRNKSKEEKEEIDEPKYHQKIKKASIYIIAILFPIFVIYASWLTAFRLGFNVFSFEAILTGFNELFKQFIVYFTGPFRALEYGIAHYAPEITPLWGQATFAGINELLYSFFHLIGVDITNINYLLADYLQNQSILVGTNVFMNYSYTSLMIFYFDFGVIGVAVLSMLFGYLTRKVVFMYEDNHTIPGLVLLVIVFLAMMISIFSWLPQTPSIVIAIAGCLVWHYSIYRKQSIDLVEKNATDILKMKTDVTEELK